jgi:carbonic anhydrase/acetyltransferase-like protein (isoleucine patch superfamily)
MNAVIMDNVDIGDESIVGALTIIRADKIIPPRSVVIGNPGKIIKKVTDEMLEWKTAGTKLYQQLPGEMFEYWKETEPLRNESEQLKEFTQPGQRYKTWNETKK